MNAAVALIIARNLERNRQLLNNRLVGEFAGSFILNPYSKTTVMMTEEQMKLVKNSWKQLRNVNAAIIGDLFYTKLFFDHPRLRKLFPSNMEQQNKKLIDMLTYVVSNIDNYKAIENDIRELGLRHIAYGAKVQHYEIIGTTLLWTLERAVGTGWNAELKEAWLVCYDTIVKTMTDAAQNTA